MASSSESTYSASLKETDAAPKKSGGWRSLFRSPATEAYNQVLGGGDKEKAKAVVQERDARSPTGHFVLGEYKPLGASSGYAEYFQAKSMVNN